MNTTNNIESNVNQETVEVNTTNTTEVANTIEDIKLPETVEELRAMLQKEGDKRVSSARKKFETEFNSKLEAEKEEATRLAKLSKQDREREAFEKERAAFEKEKAELKQQKAINEIVSELQTENLPVIFADKLLGDTTEDTLNNIKAFKEIWIEALQKAVDEKIVTKTPKMGQSLNNNTNNTSIFNMIANKKLR